MHMGLTLNWLSRRLVLGALIGLVSLGLVLWQLPRIADGFLDTRDLLVRSLAFGLLPPTIWATALGLAAWKRRHLLRRRLWNRWLATLLACSVVWGVLAYFKGATGTLEENTMGGWMGQDVKGTSDILGVFRLTAMAAAIAVVAFPLGTRRLLRRAWPRVSRTIMTKAKFIRNPYIPFSRRSRAANAEASANRGQAGRSTGAGIRVQTAPTPPVERRRPGTPVARARLTPETSLQPEAVQATPSIQQPHDQGQKPTAQPFRNPLVKSEDLEAWKLPSVSLLAEPQMDVHEPGIDQEGTASLIERTLGEYGIEVKVAEVKPGPVVTMFGLVPGWVRRSRQVKEKDTEGNPVVDSAGKPVVRKVDDNTRVKVDSIVAREKDLALALAAPSLRIEAPIPGASLVGIEVPNARPAVVSLRSIMETDDFQALRSKSRLALALGKGSGGEVAVADLARMPHLLIAGSTGSGKSVCMNAIISCIIMQSSPWETRVLLIDPKRVELTPFNGVPHLVVPVVVEVDMAVRVLKGMIQEMLRRYRMMEEASARNIEGFNRGLPPEERMPQIVICVDELADLMMAAPHDIEHSIIRLAQLGRATGIHLVVATQRPSVDVVTGLIKANFPSRISFAVASQVDSRTILDSVGAEKLLGRGDMLFQPQDRPKPRRIQGAFLSDEEIEELVDHWRNQRGPLPPEIPLEPEESDTGTGRREGDLGDELLNQAIEMATHYNRLSTSLLQRRLRIGYPRAARLMDILEDEGVVGPGEPGKSREVLLSRAGKQGRGD